MWICRASVGGADVTRPCRPLTSIDVFGRGVAVVGSGAVCGGGKGLELRVGRRRHAHAHRAAVRAQDAACHRCELHNSPPSLCFGVVPLDAPYSQVIRITFQEHLPDGEVCGHCFRTTAVDAVVCFVPVLWNVHIPSQLPHHLTRALDGWTSADTASEPQQWMLLCVLEEVL